MEGQVHTGREEDQRVGEPAQVTKAPCLRAERKVNICLLLVI
jgi:hypothetical protein